MVPPTLAAMSAPTLGRADLHVHPVGNGSSVRSPTAFLAALLAAGLDLVALTDHDRIDAAAELAARGAGTGLVLVVGEEVTSRDGHVVGLGLRAPVAPGKGLGDTVAAIHAQGGLAFVAHPLLAMPSSASGWILQTLAQGPPERRPDAVEGFNPGVAWIPGHRRRIEELAAAAGYAVVGGSDAHRPGSIGRGVTRYRGRSFAELRAAIAAGETTAEGRAHGLRDLLRGTR